MKGICVLKRLLFINILCLFWLPNFCDIKHDEADNQVPQTNKIQSTEDNRFENVPSKQEKETFQQKPDVVLRDVMPNVEYVNNLKIEDIKEKSSESLYTSEKDNQVMDTLELKHPVKHTDPVVFHLSKATKKIVKSPEEIKLTINSDVPEDSIPKVKSVSPVFVKPAKVGTEDSTHNHPHYDGMPSFDEWKKMMLAEQEKGGQKIPSPTPPGKKISSQKRRRNYSSYECGAKIVASNSESEGTSRILNELVDDYMLNPCKAKIWFVIELCETVQATQIELANFELFSSCPKDFIVYSSDNFPTRDWVPLGTFTAAEQRVLQSFELKQEGFGKFIKIELLSYYGTEHYCPLSVVRIFGTSMVDEYEEMETLSSRPGISEDDLDRLDIVVEDKKPTNIFGSATDAVINIVKKAAQALGQHQAVEEKKSNETAQNLKNLSGAHLCSVIDQSQNKCKVPIKSEQDAHLPLCMLPIPSSTMHQSLFRLLHRCDQCVSSGIRYYSSAQPHCRFFQAALGPVVFQTLCDWFKEHPIVIAQDFSPHRNKLPVSNSDSTISPTKSPPPQVIRVASENDIPWKKLISNDSVVPLGPVGQTVVLNASEPSLDVINASTLSDDIQIEPSIQPTDTRQTVLTTSFDISENISIVSENSDSLVPRSDDKAQLSKVSIVAPFEPSSSIDSTSSEFVTTLPGDIDASAVSDTLTELEVEQMTDFMSDTLSSTEYVPETMPASDFNTDSKSLDVQAEKQEKAEPVSVSGIATAGQKESVFMRMSNRIKALEINMSLSSQYLQELSQRYRRQMDEMQRAFNRTIGTLNDTAKKAAEKDLKQQDILISLQLQVANLTESVELLLNKRSSVSRQMIEIHICLMVVEAIVMITIMSLCVRRISSSAGQIPSSKNETSLAPPRLTKRRSSVDSFTPPIARKVKRRSASEEALNAGERLVIVEPLPVLIDPILRAKKRNKKRNKAITRSNSNPVVSRKNSSPASQCAKWCVSRSDSCMQGSAGSKIQCHGAGNHCENCNDNACIIDKTTEKEKRLNGAPFQNITNGSILSPPELQSYNKLEKTKERFSFKKFLRLQKRDSI